MSRHAWDVRLRTLSRWLSILTALGYLLSVATSVADAPCSDLGVYILFAAMGMSATMLASRLALAVVARTAQAWSKALAAALLTAVGCFLAYLFAMLLCRAV